MKILKTAIITLVVLLALGAIAYFLPYERILSQIPLFKNLYNNTSITVNSRNGKAVIKINEKEYGQTPVTVTDLPEGEYTIEMTRVSDAVGFYLPKTIQVELVRNTEAVVDIEIGPANIISGYTLYYSKSPNKSTQTGFVTVASQPDKASTYLDEEFFLKTPINAYELKAGNYSMKVSQDGYETVKFPIIVRDGYNLNISTYLFPIPTTLTK